MIKRAFYRALRTAAQTLAGGLVAMPTADAVLDMRAIANPLGVAVYAAILAGVVCFLQNVAEETTDTTVIAPKA